MEIARPDRRRSTAANVSRRPETGGAGRARILQAILTGVLCATLATPVLAQGAGENEDPPPIIPTPVFTVNELGEDFVVTGSEGGSMHYFPSHGDGSFGVGTEVPGLGNVDGIDVADVDNDRDNDFFVCNGVVRLYTNDGAGTFEQKAVEFGVDSRGFCTNLRTGDFNEDGLIDFVVGDNGVTNGMLIRLQTDTGDFEKVQPGLDIASWNTVGGNSLFGVTVGDVDGDGHLDVLVLGYTGIGAGQVRFYKGDGTGVMAASVLLFNINDDFGTEGTVGISVFDLERDGDLDLIVGGGFGGEHFVYTNDGFGNFTAPAGPVFDLDTQTGIDAFDFDGDEDDDLVLAAFGTQTLYYVENLGGSLAAPVAVGPLNGNSIGVGAPPLIGGPSVPLPSVSQQAEGLDAFARTGSSVSSAGNLNPELVDQDDLQDYITGSPGFTEDGGPVEAGAASVYLGSTDADARSTPDIIYTGEAAHDRAGTSVAGNFDFNGDGLPDLLIGAEQVNRSGANDPAAGCDDGAPCGAGKVYLIYFDPNDSTHYPNLDNPDVTDTVSLSLVGQAGGIPGVVFTGESLGDQAGFSVAGGGEVDLNPGQDIAIGAPGRDTAAGANAGTVYVVFNDPSLSGTVDLSRVANGQADEVDGVRYEGGAAGDGLGFSVSFPGDVVEPAGDDVAMGAPFVDVDTGVDQISTDAGTAYLSSGGDLITGIVEVCDLGITAAGAQILGDQEGEQLGYSVGGGGDLQGNGQGDFVTGAPFYDNIVEEGVDQTEEDVGRVGHTADTLAQGIIEICDLGSNIGTDQEVPGVIWVGAEPGGQLGVAATLAGDVTDNGGDDLIMGAPFTDPNDLADAGTVYVVEGEPDSGVDQASDLSGIIEVCDLGDSISGVQLTGTQEGEQAGSSLAGTGDLDGNPSPDFVSGSPGLDQEGDVDTGTVWMVLESTNLARSTLPPNEPPTANATATETLWECEADQQASVLLDGSASSDPDSTPGTNDDIVRFEWFENSTSLATGEQVSVPLNLGAHDVTLEVEDSEGETDTDSVSVTVRDTTPPTVTVTADPAELWPPNHSMVEINLTVQVDDVCEGTAPVVLDSVTSSEPDDASGGGDGHTTDDIQDAELETADFQVSLRAERQGGGPGRTYTITYRATDSSGNVGFGSAEVFVPHDEDSENNDVEPMRVRLRDNQGTEVSWDTVNGAVHYDVVRGDLDNLTVAGSEIDLGPVVCIESESMDTSTAGFEDTEIPPSGEAFFYVAQYNDGTRDSTYGTESAGRARVVQENSGDCP